jgi:hypothetical protein
MRMKPSTVSCVSSMMGGRLNTITNGPPGVGAEQSPMSQSRSCSNPALLPQIVLNKSDLFGCAVFLFHRKLSAWWGTPFSFPPFRAHPHNHAPTPRTRTETHSPVCPLPSTSCSRVRPKHEPVGLLEGEHFLQTSGITRYWKNGTSPYQFQTRTIPEYL